MHALLPTFGVTKLGVNIFQKTHIIKHTVSEILKKIGIFK